MKIVLNMVVNPGRDEWAALCERNTPQDQEIERSVEQIVERVRTGGDNALRTMAQELDGVKLESLELSAQERTELAARVRPQVKEAMRRAADNIRLFHQAQRPQRVEVETMPGVRCQQRAVPLQRVGLYIPGGGAPLFSTVLMLALPAQIAGCPEVVLCTPESSRHGLAPEIVYAADLCGVHHIYRVGGAQAVAAMALGTETVPRVDKIFGPGNRYVTKAKQLLQREVAIDMPAGPSEVLVLADHTARPDFVAADMLSQAEHGADSQALAVCQTEALAKAVRAEVERQARHLPRAESVEGSLSHSRILVLSSREEMTLFANAYAPEHLIISMQDPWQVAERITQAGSVFLGNYSPESAGDYASGTNHTLPTSGWARAYSGVNLDSFLHKITYQELTKEGLAALAPTITAMAQAEGLEAHARAVEVRIQD